MKAISGHFSWDFLELLIAANQIRLLKILNERNVDSSTQKVKGGNVIAELSIKNFAFKTNTFKTIGTLFDSN